VTDAADGGRSKFAGGGCGSSYSQRVPAWLGLTFGELFVVVFLTAFIVSAGYWPKLGAWVGERFAGRVKENAPKHTDK